MSETKKKGGAPIDNKNNLRWSAKTAQDLVDNVLSYVNAHEKCVTLAEAFAAHDTYESIVRYLKTKYEDGKEVDFTPIKKAMEILKYRIINNALYRKANPAMSIFVLKNNHGMKDRMDVTSDHESINQQITIFKLPDNGRN